MRDHDPQRDRWAPLTLTEVVALTGTTDARWWLSGGTAIDLFLARTTRAHEDVDISVARADWPVLADQLARHLELCPVDDGRIDDEHTIPVDDGIDSLWCRRSPTSPWCLQVLLEPVDGDEWTYRRDPRIRLPLREATWRHGDLRVVDPAVQLLWKSKSPRPKDDADRALVAPLLEPGRRAWLTRAVALAHPSSPWVDGR